MENTNNYQCQIMVGASAKQADLAIVSIDLYGNPGYLNEYILKEYDISLDILKKLNLYKGFDFFQSNERSILFIVTVNDGNTETNLKTNLYSALSLNFNLLSNKTIWLPLMGSGSGGLTLRESFDATMSVLTDLRESITRFGCRFVISLPDNPKGKLLFDELNKPIPDNLNVSHTSSREIPKKAARKAAQPKKVIKSASPKQNYWLLKMNPDTWKVDSYKKGIKTYFNTYYFSKERPEMELFPKIAIGDYVLGYSSGDIQSITCLMEVLTPVTQNVKDGEGFEMKIKTKYNPPIPYSHFKNIYEETSFELQKRQNPNQLFFSISENQFNYIVNSPISESQFTHPYNPSYLTEGNHGTTEDQLEFQEDINSFASVISLKSVTPPLAIGLFGNWGSGKSFFMDKLEDRIDTITKIKETEYVEHVVQVRFNSWHYSDTNLWASLTTQIFESLHDYATKKKYGEAAIQEMYKDLNITSYQLEETKRKLEYNKNKVTLLEERKVTIETSIADKVNRLSMWKLGDMIGVVISDPYIQNKFEDIKSQFKEEKLIENIGDINSKLSEIEGVGEQVKQSFILLKENRKGNWRWIWALAVLFIILGWIVLGPLKETIEHIINGGIVITGLVVTWLANTMHKLSPFFSKISQFYKRLKSLKETIDKEKQKALDNKDSEIMKLESDIQSLLTEKLNLVASQSEAEAKKLILETQLKEIGSGKLLTNFLEGRAADDAYIKQLGIISWIRKDFAKLNELFKKQMAVQNEETSSEPAVQIDRIVLYIDDLDRCNEDIVVKVLEAIHLLLAFELFVVVVGVDPRWLNNALSEKYKTLFGQKQSQPANATTETVLNGAATSYDYLEKIFQIPFALKSINKTGREKLIGYLVEDEIETTDLEPDESKKGIAVKVENREDSQKTNPKKSTPVVDIVNPVSPVIVQDATTVKKRLRFSKPEVVYMQQISAVFGKTPRTINRYVNIYRIIKAHGKLKASAEFTGNDFMPIMFLLAIIVGHSVYAKNLIAEISKAKESELFSDFMKKVDLEDNFKKFVLSNSKEIENIEMRNFIKNIELISRFSFRTLIVE